MIIFCEYVIPDTYRSDFLAWADRNADLWRGAEWLESADQPGVFVEIWRTGDEAEASRIKKERREGRSKWREMDGWVKGGQEGYKLWTFASARKG